MRLFIDDVLGTLSPLFFSLSILAKLSSRTAPRSERDKARMQYPRSHAHALYLAAHLALAACVLLVVICCGTPVTPSIAFVKLKALGRELVVGRASASLRKELWTGG